ncbi:SusC/RagA family TonB-linked outer membrane protein [Adhaeribacter arboris]|nr:SusC/RagA family TonB-linked outer membrane protein [Adhaeribacter arboris]
MKVKIPYKSVACVAAALISFHVNGQQVLSSQLTANNTGTETATSLNKRSSLEGMLKILERKYDVAFFYKDEFVQNKTVVINEKSNRRQSIESELEAILSPLQLKFEKIGANTYVISPVKVSDADKINKEALQLDSAGTARGSYLALLPQSVNIIAEPINTNVAVVLDISGKVTDEKGEGIPGATVLLKGTTTGATTDPNGNFTLSTPDGTGTLVISFIGYQTKEIAINNQTTFNIGLVPDTKALEEVVIVGYGTVQKRELTSAVTTVTSKDFVQGAVNSPLQLIDGKVPGVTISNPAAADPNRSTDVQVRGASSYKAGNGPLVVIDGMPGGDLRNVAQQDIESITVLRDAASAAIYGSRGANGVILVQTKRGRSGKVNVTYDSYVEHDAVAVKPDILSAEEFLEKQRDTDRGARTNWYDELIRENNFGQNHSLAVSGGNENSVFRISGQYRTKQGIDIATDRKEYGLRANFMQRALDGLLEFNGNLSFRDAGEEYTNYGAFRQAVQLNPTIPLMDPNNPLRYNNLQGYNTFNPVQDLTTRENGADRSYSIIDITTRLNILKNLSTDLKVARQSQDMLRREYYGSQNSGSINSGRLGRARLQNERWRDYTLEWTGNYNATFGKHDLKALAGYSYQEFNNQGFWAENEDFLSDAFSYNNLESGLYSNEAGRLGMDSWKSKEKTIGFLSRVNYGFADTYFLTGSVRYEGNTKFGPNNKWGLFPAGSAAWRISNLPGLQNLKVINDLKLRVSYGVTGRSGFDRYTAMPRYTGYGRYQNDQGEWIQVWGPANNYNPDLRWERSVAYNAGLDFTLFSSKLSGSFDAFIRKSSDLINDYQVPVPPYLHDRMYVNVGTQSSRGFELTLNAQLVNTEAFNYSTSLTASYAKSRMDEFSSGIYRADYQDLGSLPSPGNPGEAYRLQEGSEIGSFYGYKYAGVDDDGNILIWKNGQEGTEKIKASEEGDRNRDRTQIGHGMPRYDVAWNNSFTYHNFDLTLFFRGRFDYDILNLYQMYYGLTSEPGVNLLKDAYGRNAHIKSGKVITDYFLESGNYFRLDNLTLGWAPKLGVKQIENFRLYGTIRNVFTLTKFTGLDPAAISVTGLEPGLGSLDLYPIARNFVLGVQVTF